MKPRGIFVAVEAFVFSDFVPRVAHGGPYVPAPGDRLVGGHDAVNQEGTFAGAVAFYPANGETVGTWRLEARDGD